PESGARFVLDNNNRLFDVDLDGALNLKRDLKDSWIADLRLQDLCAVSATEFYTIGPRNGLRLDLENDWYVQHFCIEPGFMEDPTPWENWRQETHAIACDPGRALLFAQPQTFEREDESAGPVRSEVALYDLPSGADLEWLGLPSETYLAGGMAVVGETSVLLGRGSLLSRYDLENGTLEPVLDLAEFGISTIEGLAPDAAVDQLLVVDGDDHELVVLHLDALGLEF
ncbi:MAG: hypothetical protein VYE15_03475, partial [Myxococcota bacterium]|nr:hypothetical protein [Myxococcota bacterium]